MASEWLVDDATITNDSELWRRITPLWVVRDENAGGLRVSSAAFDDSRDGTPTSVLLATIVRETGRTDTTVLESYEGYGLASLTAGEARGCKQDVARDPLPEEPAHAFIFGVKSKANKRCLASSAVWVISPE